MIFITGSSGFIGTSIVKSNQFKGILNFNRNIELDLQGVNTVLHLAGKSQDVKKISSPTDYYKVNTDLTKKVYDAFLTSDAKVFIALSSVKAVADEIQGELTEQLQPNPVSHYGKSKLCAEQYILSKEIPDGKRVYVLRPCLIHGPGNKGNFNLLLELVTKNYPWPLGAYHNKRSYCSIDNLLFILKELIEREDIPSGIYNIADDEPLSTNDMIRLISESKNMNPKLWSIPKKFIEGVASLGDIFHLPLNTERLQKLTTSYVVSNEKIKAAIGKPLPVSSREGILRTCNLFKEA